MTRVLQDLMMRNPGHYETRVSGVVVERWQLRQREFSYGTVFNVALRESISRDQNAVAVLYFRDELAEACSFLEAGDEVTLNRVLVENNPAYDFGIKQQKKQPLLPVASVLACPQDATVTVRSCQGNEFVELTLRPGHYDSPEARLSTRGAPQKIMYNSSSTMGQPLPES
ncbi:hypothetical protein DIPPA_15588 [Diplonema papillatum]|nr:hypothetical protein DIPPA_15588 [Diplonema papillatum]